MEQRSLRKRIRLVSGVALLLAFAVGATGAGCTTGMTGATGAEGATASKGAASAAVAAGQERAQAPQVGPEYARGKALYEARCDACHDRSVHRREARSAKDFGDIRSSVVRWDRELGAIWRGEEIDAVARYLNERFYRYPCPAAVCAAQRAGTGGARSVNRSRGSPGA